MQGSIDEIHRPVRTCSPRERVPPYLVSYMGAIWDILSRGISDQHERAAGASKMGPTAFPGKRPGARVTR